MQHHIKEKIMTLAEEKATYWVLAAVLVVSFGIYVYFVNQTIWNVVQRQRLETQMTGLNNRLSELEFKYISMENDVTIDKAYALGFKDVNEPKFVSRRASQFAWNGNIMQ
jgi:hypothetical protein